MKEFFLFGKEQWNLIGSSLFFLFFAYICSIFSPFLFSFLLVISYLILGYHLFKQFQRSLFFSYFTIILLFSCSLFFSPPYLSYLILLFFSIEQVLLFQFPKSFFQEITMYLRRTTDIVLLKQKKGTKEVSIYDVKEGDTIVISSSMVVPVDGVVVRGSGVIRLDSILENRGSKSVEKGSFLPSGSIYFGKNIEVLVKNSFNYSFQEQISQSFHNHDCQLSGREKKVNIMISFYQCFLFFAFLCTFFFSYFVYGTIDTTLAKYSFFFLSISSLFYLSYLIHFAYQTILYLLGKSGILFPSKEEIITASGIRNLVFAKTGILTLGKFRVTGVKGKNTEKVLNYIRTAEEYSAHPIATAVKEYAKGSLLEIENYQEIWSKGISYTYQEKEILIGNYNFLKDHHIFIEKHNEIATVIYVVEEQELLGIVLLSDMISSYVLMQIQELKNFGFHHLAVISADNSKIVGGVSHEIGISDCYSNLTMEEKSFWLHYLKEMNPPYTAYIGDETTDALLLKEADLGIVLGTRSNHCVTLLDRDLSRIIELITFSKKFMKILRKIVFITIGMKLLSISFYLFFPGTYFIPIGMDVVTVLLSIFFVFKLFNKREGHVQ